MAILDVIENMDQSGRELVHRVPEGGSGEIRLGSQCIVRESPDQKWGTPEPIVFRDTELGMVRLRAFGAYSMQINNPQLFVNNVVGTRGVYTTDQISNYLRSIIISSLTDLLGENMKSVLD